MDLKTIYEDSDVLVVDKPAGVVAFNEAAAPAGAADKTLIDYLLEKFPELKNVGDPPRYGVVHRLDKDTSGLLLVAKTAEALIFLQKQFKNREVEKKYLALATGVIAEEKGVIHTLIGRSKSDSRKQKASWLQDAKPEGKREAISEYKVLERYSGYGVDIKDIKNGYTLLEVQIKTGRKHQIRCQLAYSHHPIAGDKLYGFKDSPTPEGLTRQFLHASYLKIKLPSGEVKEFSSKLPDDLRKILNELT